MAEPGAKLELEAIHLAFGGLKVVSGVSLRVAPGELFAIIGPNGAGKTSLLNCISGLYPPDAGRVLVDGADCTGLPSHRLAAAGIARTFQHGELFRHMTLLDNLLVGRHRHITTRLWEEALFLGRARRQEIAHRQAVEEILDFLELQRYRHQPVAGLAYGTQKLAGFARALALEPRLLLLDEPSAGLNREEKEDLARFILRIKYEMGVTMVWVEHDMQMVGDLADRIYVLNYGEFVTEGTPDQVLSHPKVVEVYLGSAEG